MATTGTAGGRPSWARHDRGRPGRRCLAEDRVPGRQRRAARQPGGARPRAAGHPRAGLPPEQRGPRPALGRYRRIGVVSLGTALYGPSTLLIALERAMPAHRLLVRPGQHPGGGGRGFRPPWSACWSRAWTGSSCPSRSTTARGSAQRGRAGGQRRRGCRTRAAAGTVVGADGVAAARMATEHLLSLGHRTVWHIPGPQDWWAARDRLRGWRRRWPPRGHPNRPCPPGDWSPASGIRRRTAARPDSAGHRGVRRQRRHGHRRCARSPRRAGRCPVTSASSATTTSPPPPIWPRR